MSTAEPAPKAPSQGSPLWHFSLRLYRVPEVAAACIRLQDEAGVDVNLLLFLLWNASLKRRFSSADVQATDQRIAQWRQNAVIPLRTIRRTLKTTPGLDPGTSEAFRTKVKGLELEAERLQQEALYELAQSAPQGEAIASAQEAARANIAAYESSCGRPFARVAVDAILDAFRRLQAP